MKRMKNETVFIPKKKECVFDKKEKKGMNEERSRSSNIKPKPQLMLSFLFRQGTAVLASRH